MRHARAGSRAGAAGHGHTRAPPPPPAPPPCPGKAAAAGGERAGWRRDGSRAAGSRGPLSGRDRAPRRLSCGSGAPREGARGRLPEGLRGAPEPAAGNPRAGAAALNAGKSALVRRQRPRAAPSPRGRGGAALVFIHNFFFFSFNSPPLPSSPLRSQRAPRAARPGPPELRGAGAGRGRDGMGWEGAAARSGAALSPRVRYVTSCAWPGGGRFRRWRLTFSPYSPLPARSWCCQSASPESGSGGRRVS